jgi:carbonic anhydrase
VSDCPVCHTHMVPATVGTAGVENCEKCSGNWIDVDAFKAATGMFPTDGRHLSCPSCGAAMQARIILQQQLDVCPSCSGIWADAGELMALTGKDPSRGIPLQDFRAYKNCPLDGIPMRVFALNGVELEGCPKCKGVWLDSGEMDRLGNFRVENGRRIFCPACGVLMNITILKDIEIDVCPQCQGTWFDKGEIETLSGFDVVHTVQMETEPVEEQAVVSTLDILVANNQEFLTAKKVYSQSPLPALNLAIITCSDPRLVGIVEHALGIKSGDAFFIKTAGPTTTGEGADLLRTVVLTTLMGGVTEVLVLGHTDCMMTKLSTAKMQDAMRNAGIPEGSLPASSLLEWMGGFTSERENVVGLVKLLRKSPLVPKQVLIHGAVIDTSTGKLTIVSDGFKRRKMMKGTD